MAFFLEYSRKTLIFWNFYGTPDSGLFQKHRIWSFPEKYIQKSTKSIKYPLFSLISFIEFTNIAFRATRKIYTKFNIPQSAVSSIYSSLGPLSSRFTMAPCTGCDVSPFNEYNALLLSEFNQIDPNNREKQKQFVHGLLSVSCSDDCYERCFQKPDGTYLCRNCLSCVLQLTRRAKLAIVPSSKFISHRYRIICLSEIFCALVVYRTSLQQGQSSRRDGTHRETTNWSHACFAAARKKVERIPTYRVHGIALFATQTQITAAIRKEKIILGALGNNPLKNFIISAQGCLIDMSNVPSYNIVLDEIYVIVSNLPNSYWKRVQKVSMAHPYGRQIEYTSSAHDSLFSWMISLSKFGNISKIPSEHKTIMSFEYHITRTISQFAFPLHSSHVVRLQPGALRSLPGTVPQRAHRDFTRNTYKEQFPGQVFIGFMPVSQDGMFLQVWTCPGDSKLLFIPFGNFLVLPANTVHAGWMCTSPTHYNLRLHFYILVSKDWCTRLSRKEIIFFENMNTYIDEESSNVEELYQTHPNCLMESKYKFGI